MIPCSEGVVALFRICRAGSVARVAKRIGVTESLIRHVLAGRRAPSADLRRRLAEHLGIDAGAWERAGDAVGTAFVESARGRSRPARARTSVPRAPSVAVPSRPSPPPPERVPEAPSRNILRPAAAPNDGARRLREALLEDSRAHLARLTGLAASTLGQYARGTRIPNRTGRTALLNALEIPPVAWACPPYAVDKEGSEPR